MWNYDNFERYGYGMDTDENFTKSHISIDNPLHPVSTILRLPKSSPISNVLADLQHMPQSHE